MASTNLRFTIRDLLWLTALVALAAGWWVDHRHQVARVAREKNANVDAAVKLQIEWLRRYRGDPEPPQ